MRPARERRDVLVLAAVAAAAAAALLWPALRRGEGLLPTGSLWRFPPWNAVLPAAPGNGLLVDQLLDFWPWRLFQRAEMLSGRFPLWNPWIAGGVPFAGCVQAAPFFPTSLLLPLLPPAAWSLAAAFLKLFVAGLFAGLYARRLGAKPAGAALSAVSFALCGFMVAWLGHPQTNAACLLPALFWALEAGVVWTAAAVGLILLGGHPPTALHVLAAGAAYVVFVRRERRRPAAWGALAGAGLAAPALLPYLEYAWFSSTAASAAALARWSTHLSPWAALHVLMPLASGSPTRGAEMLAAAFGLGAESNFVERAAWIGLPGIAFAALATVRRRGPETRFLAALALFGLAAALGVPPLPWLWRVLPGFSAANPTRLLLLFCFGASILAGLACDEDAEPASRRFLSGSAAVAAAALVVSFVRVGLVWGGLAPVERGFALGQAAAFAVEAVAALWLLARPRARRWAPLVAALFLWRVGAGLNPSAPVETLYPRTPGLDALAAEQGEGRVFGLGWSVAPDLGMPAGLRDARGRDFITLRRYEEVVAGRAGDFDFYSKADALPPSPALLGISALAATPKTAAAVPPGWTPVHQGDLLVFRSPTPGRRALFVPEARAASSPEILAKVREPGFDPAKTVWLEEAAGSSSSSRGTAHIVAETPDRLEVSVESNGPGWLLLLDNWYPGWQATVDGKTSSIRRADYSFRAVEVPAGLSTVRFFYRPRSFWLGIILCAFSALGLVALRRI